MSVPAFRFKQDDGKDFPDWGNTTLKDVSINYYQGINTAADKVEYIDGGVPIIQAKHITGEYLDFSDARGLSQSDYDKYKKKYNPKVNDLLISNIGTLGKVVLVEAEINFLVAWNIFKVTLNSDRCYPQFIRDFLKKIASDGYFDSIKTGNATKFINKSDMLAIEIVFPCLREQTKIANFLTAVDEKISLLTQKHNLLNQYKKGVMQKIFSQELRFKDDDGKDFPEWENKLISEALNNYGGTALEEYVCSDGTHNFISIGNYEKNGNYFDNGQRIVLNEKTKQKLLKKDDLVMVLNDKTQAGDLIGATLLIKDDNKFIYNQRSERLVCNRGVVEPKFIWHLFNSAKFRKEIFSISQGGTQIYVNFPAVKKINISVPHIKEQTKIANFLTAIDEKITNTQTQLQALKQYKKGLLQQMFV
jgi:type I restriction enzyme S subunit